MKRYTEDEKQEILKEVSELSNITLVSKKHGISPASIHRWIKQSYAQKSRSSLADENKRLKKDLGQAELTIAILNDLLKKTHLVL